MTYVRTKDNIYLKIGDTEYDNEHIIVGKTPVDFGTYILKKDIIKQSDNLADLCDEIVGIDNTYGHQFLRAFPYKCAYYWNGGVYGAIWYEGGLKYVAKVDNKGGLELI